MKEIDAQGLDCPKPVVKTKKALNEANKVKVLVDDEVQAENVAKLAKKMKGELTILEEDDHYQVSIEVAEDAEAGSDGDSEGKVYFITSDTLGEGEEELGNVLMKGFLSTLLDIDPIPEKVIFMNSGVKVPALNEEAEEHLKELEAEGVEILSCGTCLDYYGIEEELEVGNISNMYEILSAVNNNRVVEV